MFYKNEMGMNLVEAYILVTSAIGKVDEVAKELKGLENVKSAQMVTGAFDIVVLVEAEDLSALTNVVLKNVHKIDGIIDTTTAIVVG